MALDTLDIDTGPAPTRSVIVLHGLGDDGHGWAPIAQELDLSPLGSVRLVLPHAPLRPVTINGGYVMRAWYDILGTDLARREDEAGLRTSQAAIEALIEREAQRGIAARHVALVGFSQGCAMALLTGLRHRERLAGIAGLSGYLPLAAATAAERSEANRDVPLFLAHGTQDPVVQFQRGTASRDALAALGYDIEWHDYAMPHSVCAEEVDDLNRWLLRVLAD
ncbi:MAG: dienelactone hydrolase family protein [Rhizobacter sp.]|nr:dienelactone hydrolase family protein [Rhizobacter sp.]